MPSVQENHAKHWWLSVVEGWVISYIVFFAYHRLLEVGFYAEDNIAFNLLLRLSVPDYIKEYLGLNAAATFLRPVQGFQFWLEYASFGNLSAPYRALQILIHLGNCLLLYALVNHITKSNRIALVTALIFAVVPSMISAFFWITNADGLVSFFYLLSIAFWLRFLEKRSWITYASAFGIFILALLTKEIGVTLPIALFLAERWLVGEREQLIGLVQRYAPFVGILVAYGLYSIQRLGGFTNAQYGGPYAGFGPGIHMLSNLVHYAGVLADPWADDGPGRIAWLIAVLLFLAYLIVIRRHWAIGFLAAMAILPILPVLPLNFVSGRYLYLSAMAAAVLMALLVEQTWKISRSFPGRAMIVPTAIALLIFGNSIMVVDAFDAFATYARKIREPVRPIFQQHSKFPSDTLVYFINSPIDQSILSGMFTLHYGNNPLVGGTGITNPAQLRDHPTTYVYYFDEQNRPKEQTVSQDMATTVSPTLPIDFHNGIRLEGYEVANPKPERGEDIVLLLYWRANARVDKDWTVFAHLLNLRDETIAGVDGPPRAGKSSTTSWQTGQLIVDWIIMPVPYDAVPEQNYRLEIGWYDPQTMERPNISDSTTRTTADQLVIEPIYVVE
jgi:dolichyl-phosphate-mannose-protein mannosyltransferase